jgi:hypothetical protein
MSTPYTSSSNEKVHRVIFINEEYFVPYIGPPCPYEVKVIEHQNLYHHISKVISRDFQELIPSTLLPLYELLNCHIIITGFQVRACVT